MNLAPLAPDLWEMNAPLSVAGMQLGHRMTVAHFADGTLWIHSPVAHTPELDGELRRHGRVAHIIAPSLMHDTYLEGWFAAYPKVRFHGAPGFARTRPDLPFTDTLTDVTNNTWADVFDQHVLQGMPRVNEVAFLHRASRTLILTDLAFNLGPDMPFLSRVLLKLNDCDCKFGPSRLIKSTIKDRAALRRSLDHILNWEFDAIVLSHGSNVNRGGKPMLRQAFAFL